VGWASGRSCDPQVSVRLGFDRSRNRQGQVESILSKRVFKKFGFQHRGWSFASGELLAQATWKVE